MPSAYAHQRFGNQVLEKLPASIQGLIRRYQAQYDIGLQGPDFLFFYRFWKKNPVNQLGLQIHHTPATELFYYFRETLRKKGPKTEKAACVLGTVCHFMLDSACHSYVREQMKETGVGHVELETEFDRFLMTMDGLDPLRYKLWKTIPVDQKTAQCLADIYESGLVDEDVVRHCLKDMKRIKRLLTAPGAVKQKILRSIMHLTGHYDELQGHMMALEPNPKCDRSNQGLLELFNAAVEETVVLIEEYYDGIITAAPLNPRFDRDFE